MSKLFDGDVVIHFTIIKRIYPYKNKNLSAGVLRNGWGLGPGVWGLGFGVWGLSKNLPLEVWGLGSEIGSGVWRLGSEIGSRV